MLLVMQCWCQTAVNSRHQDVALQAVFELWDLGQEHYPSVCLDMLFNIVDVRQVVAHFRRVFTYKDCVARILSEELQIMLCFIMGDDSTNPLIVSRLVECNIYKDVIKATRRQLKSQKKECIGAILRNSTSVLLYEITFALEFHCEFTVSNRQILEKTPGAAKFIDTFTDILENQWAVEACSKALVRAESADEDDDTESEFNFFHDICHIVECKGSQGCSFCNGPTTESFINAAKKSVERIAFSTAAALGEDSTHAGLWSNLISCLEITVESARKRFHLDKKCCNVHCPKRNLGNRSKKTCVRCQSVYYCDRNCQERYGNLVMFTIHDECS